MTQSDMHTWIVDRIENGIAVLEGDTGPVEVPSAWLPGGAQEGTVLRVQVTRERGASRLVFTLSAEAQHAREAEIRELRDSIQTGPDGDIAL